MQLQLWDQLCSCFHSLGNPFSIRCFSKCSGGWKSLVGNRECAIFFKRLNTQQKWSLEKPSWQQALAKFERTHDAMVETDREKSMTYVLPLGLAQPWGVFVYLHQLYSREACVSSFSLLRLPFSFSCYLNVILLPSPFIYFFLPFPRLFFLSFCFSLFFFLLNSYFAVVISSCLLLRVQLPSWPEFSRFLVNHIVCAHCCNVTYQLLTGICIIYNLLDHTIINQRTLYMASDL